MLQAVGTTTLGDLIKGKGEFIHLPQVCLRGYQLKKVLGRGTFGTVANACFDGSCKYAVKIIKRGPDVEREINITKKLWEKYQIGPRFYDSWDCGDRHVIVTDMWDGDLPKNVCPPDHILKKLCKQIQRMHDAGYVHGDILEKNILIKTVGKEIVDTTLADFGTVRSIEDWLMLEEKKGEIMKFHMYHFDPRNDLTDYYKENNVSLEDVLKDPRHLDKDMMWKLYKVCGTNTKTFCLSNNSSGGARRRSRRSSGRRRRSSRRKARRSSGGM